MAASITARVLQLAGELRRLGVPLGPGDAAVALAALERVGLAERDLVRAALRCTLARDPEAVSLFDALFDRYFGLDGQDGGRAAGGSPVREPGVPALPERQVLGLRSGEGATRGDGAGWLARGGYSPVAVRRRAVWLGDGDGSDAALRRAAERLARRLATRRSRRYAPARRGPRLDLRRLLRASLRAGGEALRLAYRRRRPRLWRLVALCDVSGSMDPYARLLLRFVHALQQVAPRRVEAFAFSTSVRRITAELRRRHPEEALERAVAVLPDWGGGTRIGECLDAWCRRYGAQLLGRNTVVVVLSDGLDMGHVAPLERALERMRRGSRRLIWLNPLAADPRYRPLARGMSAALPYLDALLPAGDLASLERIGRYVR